MRYKRRGSRNIRRSTRRNRKGRRGVSLRKLFGSPAKHEELEACPICHNLIKVGISDSNLVRHVKECMDAHKARYPTDKLKRKHSF